ncbi:hypothetical protein ABPG75_002452, partial [Micractinium tetrahymenae]
MLHRNTQVTLNSTPRHRGRHAAMPWPSDVAAGAHGGRRPRLNSRVALSAAALALTVVIFNAGKQAAQHTEAQSAVL